MKDYSSGQSLALAASESFYFTPEDQAHTRDQTDCFNLAFFIILVFFVFLLLLGVFNYWFGSFVVVIVELFMLLCISISFTVTMMAVQCRQHCRLSICENWLSWTNTETAAATPPTVMQNLLRASAQ